MAEHILLKLDANLQQLSITPLAIKLWELPDIRKEVKEIFKDNPNFPTKEFYTCKHKVVQKLYTIHLPEKILWEIQEAIHFIGKNLFRWHYNLKTDFHLSPEYAEKICWSCYGTVDEAKTFQLHWQNDWKLTNSRSKRTLYHIACTLAQKEFISDNLSDMREILKSSLKIPANISADSLIKKWFHNYKKEGIDHLKLNREAELLLIFSSKGLLNAAKHFGQCLKEKTHSKTFFLTIAIVTLLECWRKREWERTRNSYAEILVFLINEMSPKGQILFIRKNLSFLFVVLINIWPYQEIFLQIFKYIIPYMTENNYVEFLDSIIDFLFEGDDEEFLNSVIDFLYFRDGNLTKLPHFKTTLLKILQKILELIPKEAKKKKADYLIYLVFDHFIKLNNFAGMKVILNDPDIMTFREEIIESGISFAFPESMPYDDINNFNHNIFQSWIIKNEFDLLNFFAEEFLTDMEKKKKFKYKFQPFLVVLLIKVHYELTDKLLDWITDSKEEKIELKNQIDIVKVIDIWHQQKRFSLSAVDELLKWKFEGDEGQIKLCKMAMSNEDFVRDGFYKTWGANCIFSVETAKAKCSEFLKFFVEEVEIFKSEKIITKDFLYQFCDHLQLPKNFESIDEFLKFCSVPFDRVKEIKKEIRDDIDRWIYFFGVKEGRFRIADALVNWIAENENDKKKIIGKFANSSVCAKLFYETMKTCTSAFYDSALILLNAWIKIYGNISVIIGHYSDCNLNDKWIPLLRKLEASEHVLIDDLRDYVL